MGPFEKRGQPPFAQELAIADVYVCMRARKVRVRYAMCSGLSGCSGVPGFPRDIHMTGWYAFSVIYVRYPRTCTSSLTWFLPYLVFRTDLIRYDIMDRIFES